ncbi:hypothetical protein [Nocardiopsis nanhaiensis]
MKWWKALGAAAFVGVAATGVAVARAERQRRAYTPDQVRERLHDRVAEVSRAGSGHPDAPSGSEEAADGNGARRLFPGLRSRLTSLRDSRPLATTGRWLRGTRGGGRDRG